MKDLTNTILSEQELTHMIARPNHLKSMIKGWLWYGGRGTLYCTNLYALSGRKLKPADREYTAVLRGDAHPKGLRAARRAARLAHRRAER